MKSLNIGRFGLVIFVAISISMPLLALSQAATGALDAFRRYEPDFATSLRKIQDLARRLDNQKIDLKSKEGEKIRSEAEDIMEFVQKRYDLLEDLYKGVSEGNPNDRAALMDGFQKIDDLYRQVRDFYNQRFLEDTTKSSEPKIEQTETISPELATDTAKISSETEVKTEQASATVLSRQSSAEEKLKLSGKLQIDLKNKNEVYNIDPEKALPNNLYQGKLTLEYQFDSKNKGLLEDRYLQRRRNELVKENILTLSLLHQHSPKSVFSFKDTLHHVIYPQNQEKNYRNNLAEIFWDKKEGKFERLYNFGYENRKYPNYSRSDFGQLNFKTQQTYFVQNGTLFAEFTWNDREYKNSRFLDYKNANFNIEFNRSYSGNKSDFTLSNVYDRRSYGEESVNLFRTSYWDNYFTLKYDLPVSETFTWVFEDEYQKRKYASDEPRGYAQLKLKTTAKINIDKKTKGKISHQYIFNDENTRQRAHKNHIFNVSYDKKVTDKFKVKVEDTFHRRSSLVGDVMDFKENMFGIKATWSLPSKIELSWKNEYLIRRYSSLFYSDFAHFTSGINGFYAKPKKYDWNVYYHWRKFRYRNGKNVATDWIDRWSPKGELKFNWILQDDLKVVFTALSEKTYYRSFDTLAQELNWDFSRPITVTEFYGGLEYTF